MTFLLLVVCVVEFYKNSQKRLAKVYTRIQKFGSKEILFDYLNRQLKKLVIQDYSSPIQNKSVPSQTSESEGEQNSSDQNSAEQSRPDQNSAEQSGSDENNANNRVKLRYRFLFILQGFFSGFNIVII